jgi:hypothetical protein
VTLDYEQAEMNGPPFSVGEAEVRALFGDTHELELLERSVPDGWRSSIQRHCLAEQSDDTAALRHCSYAPTAHTSSPTRRTKETLLSCSAVAGFAHM